MNRWATMAAALALAVLAAAPGPAGPRRRTRSPSRWCPTPPTLDPHMHFERVGVLVNINMFDSLLHRNTKLEFEPGLATSWKALSDTTWEFKIRKGRALPQRRRS